MDIYQLHEFMYNRPGKPKSPQILFCSQCGWNSEGREWKFCGNCGKDKLAPVVSGIPPPEIATEDHREKETVEEMIFFEDDDDCLGAELLEEIYGSDNSK